MSFFERMRILYAADGGGGGGGDPGAGVSSPPTPASPAAPSSEPAPSATPSSPPEGAGSPAQPSTALPGVDDNTDALSSDVDWTGFDTDIDDIGRPDPKATPPAPTPSPASATPPAAPAAPPAATPPPAAQPAATAPPNPAQAQPPQPTPPAATPPAPAQQTTAAPDMRNPQTVADLMASQRDQIVQGLAAQAYAISPEVAEGLATEPEKHIPQLMAQVHYNVAQALMTQMATFIPHMLQQHSTVQAKQREYEDAYFEKWPGLKGHKKEAMEGVRMFRRQYPQASIEDVIAKAGAMTHALLGIPVGPAPAAPSAQNGNRGGTPVLPPRATAAPFVPAGATPPPAIATQPPADDPWAGLGGDYDDS